MTAYVTLFWISLSEFFVYRLNFVLWRLRNLITLGMKYFLWVAVYETSTTLFGFDKAQMLTYILLSNTLSDVTMSTKTGDLAGEILNGSIINYILRPIRFFGFNIARDLADKTLNIAFSVLEVIIIVALLHPPLFIQTNALILGEVFLFLILGMFIAFCVNLLLSFIAFWSTEVWAPRFIFWMLMLVCSGNFFPLDVLPKTAYYALFFTPFPYLYYLPSRIYFGLPQSEILLYFCAALGWCVLSAFIVHKVWKRGLREYSFFGR